MRACKILAILGLVLIMIGCSRKPDEELPARLGDLIVRCKIVDEASLPSTIPVTLTIFNDTTETTQLRSQSVVVASEEVKSVEFKDMAVGQAYLELRVDAAGVAEPTCPELKSVFVQLNKVTETQVFTITVRPEATICE